MVLDEGEQIYEGYISYIPFLYNTKVPSERSHSTVYNYAGYFPILRMWGFGAQPLSTLIAQRARPRDPRTKQMSKILAWNAAFAGTVTCKCNLPNCTSLQYGSA